MQFSPTESSPEPRVIARLTRSARQAYRASRRSAGQAARRIGVYPALAAARSRAKSVLHRGTPVPGQFNGVTVIIPTHRPNEYLEKAIASALHQDLPPWQVDVIVSVNGPNIEHYEQLVRHYRWNPRVRVIHTPRVGLSAGRNFALWHVRKDLVTYLDDDDYFTSGYLREMMVAMTPEVELVCGRLEDERAGKRGADTYINRALATFNDREPVSDYVKAASLLTSAWAKLYRTDFAKNHYRRFDEGVTHTEDVRFWVNNIDKLTLPLALVPANSSEALVRRVTEGSMSRPSDERAYDFWITDRLDILRELESLVFRPGPSLANKRFIMVKIDSQSHHLRNHFRSLSGERRERARKEVLDAGLTFLNTSFVAVRQGIAFCHNFAPFRDASAYVATKRLPQIAELVGEPVAWHVVSADMARIRGRDWTFGQFYARHQYDRLTQIPGPVYFNPLAQHQWAMQAIATVEDEPAEVIYSRSMFAGSHEAAYRYKQAHPDVVWFAEFSDPIYLDTTGSKRSQPTTYTGDEAWLNDYWQLIENWVYEAADHILFTNANQRSVMLDHAAPELKSRGREHSDVLTHPVLDSKWSEIVAADYELDSTQINVGYFGSFYENRSAEQLLTLLDDPRVHLHLFVPNPKEVRGRDRLHVHQTVEHLRFLSIGKAMDYLVLNDIQYAGDVNPYIPSKLADYLATGTSVLAFIEAGSILSQHESEQVVRLGPREEFDLGQVIHASLV